jgi:RND family efflux transporter MFP subunit
VAGRIEHVYVNAVGDEVTRGQPIVNIYSPQLLTTSEELVSAIRYAEELKERDALPQSILDAEAMVKAAEKRLRLWGLRPEQLERIKKTRKAETDVVVYATASGTVHKKMIYDGQYVKEGSPLYELIDFGELWVYLNVFENDLGYVYQGMPIKFTTPAFQNKTFYGRVSEIEPMMDTKSRTGRVRVAISNTGGHLIPGMYVESEIQIPISSGQPTVSNLAVIRTGERDIVIVSRGGGKFYPQEVALGRLADGYYPILSGLKVGQEVVSQASFLIDSESQLKSALQQLRGGGHQH